MTSFFGSGTEAASASSFDLGPNWSRAPLTNSLGLAAIVQKLETVDAWIFFLGGNRSNWNSHSNHALHSRVRASGVHADRRAKRESGEDEG